MAEHLEIVEPYVSSFANSLESPIEDVNSETYYDCFETLDGMLDPSDSSTALTSVEEPENSLNSS